MWCVLLSYWFVISNVCSPGHRETSLMSSQAETHLHPKWRALAHTHCTGWGWRTPPLHEALHSSVKSTFNKAAENKPCLLSPHSTFNFLLSFVSAGIFPYLILSPCSLSPSGWKGLSLKFMVSSAGTHARPGDNRLTYLPCSFISPSLSVSFFPPPRLPSFTPLPPPPRLWIDHGHCNMTAVSCALALQMSEEKWSLGVLSHGPAERAGTEDQRPEGELLGPGPSWRGDVEAEPPSSALTTHIR